MSLPGRVEVLIGDERIIERVALDSDETLFTTPSRAITYRESSFLSDESVEEFPTDVDRFAIEDGPRNASIIFEYPTSEDRELTVSVERLPEVIPAVLGSVLLATDTLDPDETVIETYRFNELTLVITERRLLKHIGTAVWGQDFDAIDYDDVTGLRTEEGTVATQLVLHTAGVAERLKVPQESARAVITYLEEAICAHHGVSSIDALGGPGDDQAEEDDAAEPLLKDLEPLRMGGSRADPTERTDSFDSSEFEPPKRLHHRLEAQLAELTEAMERQQALLEQQHERLERIEEALNRDR